MKRIDEFDAENHMFNWIEYIRREQAVPVEIFQLGTNNNAYDYKVSIEDFRPIISQVGIAQVKVRFGYFKEKFRLILWGANEQGKRVTPFMMTQKKDLEDKPATKKASQSQDSQIPHLLVALWREDWQKLIQKGQLPRGVFYIRDQPLRGYTFRFNDFLRIFEIKGYKNPSKSRVCFGFINHQYSQDSDGVFGLLVYVEYQSQKKSQEGYIPGEIFYDHSAPCPPTCGDE